MIFHNLIVIPLNVYIMLWWSVSLLKVLRERSLQIEFNKAERAKELEANRLLKIEQNLDAERYKKDRWEQKLKQAETKKANAAFFLKEWDTTFK